VPVYIISSLQCEDKRDAGFSPVKYWEIIANNLKRRGWSLGYVSAIDSNGRTIWIVDAHRNGKRFVVRADEKLTAFVELERVTRESLRLWMPAETKSEPLAVHSPSPESIDVGESPTTKLGTGLHGFVSSFVRLVE